jgi:hypothetical protein
METPKRFKIKLASILVPTLLMITIFSSTLLNAEGTFYRIAYDDGQSFYRWLCGWICYYDGRFHGEFYPPPNGSSYNPNFFYNYPNNPHYFYPYIDSAGFNYVWTGVISSTLDVYPDSLHVWHWNDSGPYYYRGVNYYGGSQCAELMVGYDANYPRHIYFVNPHNGMCASSGYDGNPYNRYVFYSIPGTHYPGAVIDTCLWDPFHPQGVEGDNNFFYVQLVMRIDPGETDTGEVVLTVSAFDTCTACQTDNNQYVCYDLSPWKYENTYSEQEEERDNYYSHDYTIGALSDFVGVYRRLQVPLGVMNPDGSHHLGLKIFWHGNAVFYLDSVRVMDQGYLYALDSAKAETLSWIHDAAAMTMGQDWCAGRCIDEPFPIQYRALATVDDIVNCIDNTKHHFSNLFQFVANYFR